MTERICPNCGNPVLEFGRRQEPPVCSPIQSPECWRVGAVYDRDLRRWVMTHHPGEPAPTAAEFRDRRRA